MKAQCEAGFGFKFSVGGGLSVVRFSKQRTLDSEEEGACCVWKPEFWFTHLFSVLLQTPSSAAATLTPVSVLGHQTSLSHLGLCRPNGRLLSPGLMSKAQVRKPGAGVLWRLWAKWLSQEFNQHCPLSPGSRKRQTALVKQESNFPSRRQEILMSWSEPALVVRGPRSG